MSSSDTLAVLGIVIAAVGSMATVGSVLLVLMQMRGAEKVAKGEFLLHMADMLRQHDAAYQASISRTWTPKDTVSSTDMENYMSLLEQFKVLIDYGIIDLDVFDRLHGYRVMLLVVNPTIYDEWLTKSAAGWPDFIQLSKTIASRRKSEAHIQYPEGIWSDRRRDFIARAEKLVVVR